MYSSRRALLAAIPAFALAGCFGKPGGSPAAQDAQLIVKAITPVAQRAGSAGAGAETLRQISESLTIARSEAAALDIQGTPGLLDVQQFHLAARDLLQTLAGLPGLSAEERKLVEAARQLLPTFSAVDAPVSATTLPAVVQARQILQEAGGEASTPRPTPPPLAQAAPPAAAATGRFHLSADDFAGQVSFQFFDNGQVIEKGTVPDLHALEIRFAAFRRSRLLQAP